MKPHVPLAWAAGTAVLVLLFAGLGFAGRLRGGVLGTLFPARLVGALGVLPSYGIALAWRNHARRTRAGWCTSPQPSSGRWSCRA